MSTSGLSYKQQAYSRPHFRAVRKVLWKMVKNCVRNRSRPDEIDTDIQYKMTHLRVLKHIHKYIHTYIHTYISFFV